jgi:hypothetical protein
MSELNVTLMTRTVQSQYGMPDGQIVEKIIAEGTLSILPERFHIIKIEDRTFTVTDIEWDLAVGNRPDQNQVESLSRLRHHKVNIILAEVTK